MGGSICSRGVLMSLRRNSPSSVEIIQSLGIDRHLLLHYPFCDALYVSPSASRLAARLSAGFELLVADGSFDALFAKYYGKVVADLDLRHRVVVNLKYPDLPAWVPIDRKELWFDPAYFP